MFCPLVAFLSLSILLKPTISCMNQALPFGLKRKIDKLSKWESQRKIDKLPKCGRPSRLRTVAPPTTRKGLQTERTAQVSNRIERMLGNHGATRSAPNNLLQKAT
jgi:hypothetical protein